ncbi:MULTISPECIES: SDR family oxidoreductase [unclassified Gemella]|uniref:SDR family oxidoreductase n=1 Tax=unclassified Gemella TaxID=2624949 RepID=UPI001C54C1C6|nr:MULTISPECIES: SDR family oxidoreductase [unclassified Gemella]
MSKVLLVTGASKGIGLEIVINGLERGYIVVGTSRNTEKLKSEVARTHNHLIDNFFPLSMNLDKNSVNFAIEKIINKYGKVDVVVNNAGYAILGALEEFSIEEIKDNFDVNVFGTFNVMKAVLPYMRKQKSGSIINLASISGSVTGVSQSIYSATKSAVIMMSEALSLEVAEFNIKVTAICPGGVRTDFLDTSSMRKPKEQISEYNAVQQTMKKLDKLNHNQSGDPKLVAKAILEVAEMEKAPKRLYLNAGAVSGIKDKVSQILSEVEENIDLSLSTDSL